MKVGSHALGTEQGPIASSRVSRPRLRLSAIITLLVLLFCSLSFSSVSLVGSTVGETWRKQIVRMKPMKATLLAWSKFDWIGTRPDQLSEPGSSLIVLDYRRGADGGILFSRTWQVGYTLWVEHSVYETSITHTIKDEDVLRQAGEILKQHHNVSLPAGIEKGSIVVKRLNWLGIGAELMVLASLLVIICTTAREWIDARKGAS